MWLLTEWPLPDAVAWAVVERAPDGIVAVDEAGHIVLANDQLSVLFGYQRAELLGQPIEVLVPVALIEQHHVHRQGYQVDPHTRTMGAGLELRGRRRDGLSSRSSPWLGRMGRGQRRGWPRPGGSQHRDVGKGGVRMRGVRRCRWCGVDLVRSLAGGC